MYQMYMLHASFYFQSIYVGHCCVSNILILSVNDVIHKHSDHIRLDDLCIDAHLEHFFTTHSSNDEFQPLAKLISNTPIHVTMFNNVFNVGSEAIVPLSNIRLMVGFAITSGNAKAVRKMGPEPRGWSRISRYKDNPAMINVR